MISCLEGTIGLETARLRDLRKKQMRETEICVQLPGIEITKFSSGLALQKYCICKSSDGDCAGCGIKKKVQSGVVVPKNAEIDCSLLR